MYPKYLQEEDHGIQNAYNYIYARYDERIITPEEFADLCVSLYTQRKITIVSYTNRKRAHNMLPKVAEQLVETDPERALKCLQLYAKWEYHYNIRERDQKIKTLTGDNNTLRSAKLYRLKEKIRRFLRKVKGGIKCYQEHGWNYTWHHGIEKIKKKIENKHIYRIWNVFCYKVMSGYKLYSKVIEKRGTDARLFLAGPANGDTYLLGLMYRAYAAKQYPTCEPVFGAYKGGGKTISEMLGICDFETYSIPEFSYLYNLVMFDTRSISHIECLHYHVFLRHIAILAYIEGIHNFNMYSLAQEYLDIADDEITKPQFSYDQEKLLELFAENNLLPYKTVVLEPYAKSMKLIPIYFWYKLALRLRSLGYCVCTNSSGPSEPPIEGTAPVFVPYSCSVPFLESAGASVGLRSGFQDVINSAKCLKVTLYRDDWKRSVVCKVSKSFSMSEMYHQSDQYDLLYTADVEEQLLEEITHLVQEYLGKEDGLGEQEE